MAHLSFLKGCPIDEIALYIFMSILTSLYAYVPIGIMSNSKAKIHEKYL